MFAVSLPRFCGGLIKDIKRKAPFFASDFYDALNIQALSAILFIYLATVTNSIVLKLKLRECDIYDSDSSEFIKAFFIFMFCNCS